MLTPAREMRREGESLKSISRATGAALSSVSLWVRDIPLLPEQQQQLDAANPVLNGREVGQRVWSAMRLEARRQAQDRGRALAAHGDPLHHAGCMLHWAEGSKSTNHVVFVNSDVHMMRFFLRFLRECYGIEDRRITLNVNWATDSPSTRSRSGGSPRSDCRAAACAHQP